MDLRSDQPWWLIRNGILATYPAVGADLRCEVAVIGGGITGALVALRLAQAGVDVVLLDKRDIGQGSTSASTALVQYELDVPLHELARRIGESQAARIYTMCRDAIDQLEQIVREGNYSCGFERTTCVQLASKARDDAMLAREHEARQRHGFRTEFFSRDDARARFSFARHAALRSADAAQIDPYRLTHGILCAGCACGLRVFDRTAVVQCRPVGQHVRLETQRGHLIHADRAIFAVGYEAQQYLRQKLARLQSTFAVVSDVIDEFTGWPDRCLIWETAKPYHYLRTTEDRRAMIGGGDIRSANPAVRDRLVCAKARRLARHFTRLFPQIPFECTCAWGGVFAETRDSLPYIGESPEFRNALFALGYGANGITFGVLAADILLALHEHGGHPDAHLFRFDR
jgi:glycine/D-amino acid oxidase-like deaminating enzyme